MTLVFRVHFSGEAPIEVHAENSDKARKEAEKARPGARITKIKLKKGA